MDIIIMAVAFPYIFSAIQRLVILVLCVFSHHLLTIDMVELGSEVSPFFFRTVEPDSACIAQLFNHQGHHAVAVDNNLAILIPFAPLDYLSRLSVPSVETEEYPSRIFSLQFTHPNQVSPLVKHRYTARITPQVKPDDVIRVVASCDGLRAVVIENPVLVHEDIIYPV